MVNLQDLSDNAGARKNRTRVGRGIGSGKGKTAGRGVKGQKSRSGVAIKGFEGGQMPIFRRLPKRGFTNINRVEYQVVNIQDIANAISSEKLSNTDVITLEDLQEAGLIRNSNRSTKLLGSSEVKDVFKVSVHKASNSAVAAVEKAGGTVTIVG